MDGTSRAPPLARVFELIAALMGLDRGERRLELLYADGRLRHLYVHHERVLPAELERFSSGLEDVADELRVRIFEATAGRAAP